MKLKLGKISDMTLVLSTVALLLVALRLWSIDHRRHHHAEVHGLYGITGPQTISTLPEIKATPIETYQIAGQSSLAVLLTDKDSSWLGIAHGLKAIGVPFTVTRSYEEAFQHSRVLLYPYVSEDFFEGSVLKSLQNFVKKGGEVFANNVIERKNSNLMNELFGFKSVIRSEKRYTLNFPPKDKDPREASIRLGDPKVDPKTQLETMGYTLRDATELARFDDGSSAFFMKTLGKGKLYTLGFDLGYLALIAQNGRDDMMERSYVNQYEPTLDVFLRLVQKFYQEGNPQAVVLFPVPDGKKLAVLLTHDLDYNSSYEDAIRFAKFENSQHIRGTYFIQTKYVQDYEDTSFFSEKTYPFLRKIKDLGMELGSHSVAHSLTFYKFPMGKGTERFPDYAPYIRNKIGDTDDGSILGELRVSKFLIENLVPDNTVTTFRPGDLRSPFSLPEALEATGYQFSSSETANNSLTHLPFQTNHTREFQSESSIFEFPITVEDEERPAMADRVDAAVALADKIGKNGGLFNILIHPNFVKGDKDKLEFEKGFVDRVRAVSWFGSVSDLGTWWAARNKVQVQVEATDGGQKIVLQAPEKISGLALDIPAHMKLVSNEPSLEIHEVNGHVVLGEFSGRVTLRLWAQ